MKGRGIGTARGRATIMRANGASDVLLNGVLKILTRFLQLVVVVVSQQPAVFVVEVTLGV